VICSLVFKRSFLYGSNFGLIFFLPVAITTS
jgi:hypothetical protein